MNAPAGANMKVRGDGHANGDRETPPPVLRETRTCGPGTRGRRGAVSDEMKQPSPPIRSSNVNNNYDEITMDGKRERVRQEQGGGRGAVSDEMKLPPTNTK